MAQTMVSRPSTGPYLATGICNAGGTSVERVDRANGNKGKRENIKESTRGNEGKTNEKLRKCIENQGKTNIAKTEPGKK